METTLTKHERNLGSAIHAATLLKFFVPFGNFIIPLVLWIANKKDSAFADHNGKQALNFQISLLLYTIILGIISVPFLIVFFTNIFDFSFFGFEQLNYYNNANIQFDSDNFNLGAWMLPLGLAGLAQGGLFILNIVYTILATLRTNEGQVYEYPISIKFIR